MSARVLWARGTLALGILLCTLGAVRAEVHSSAASAAVERIDLATALRLAGLNNLDLAQVRAAQHAAQAANDAATLRFVPSVTIGQTFAHRSGADQQTSGSMLEVDKRLYRRGASVGLSVELGDALFNKLAALQLERAAGEQVRAQRETALVQTSAAYFDLVAAVSDEDIAAQAVRISQDYQSQLERAAAIGLTNRSEALRVAVQTQQARIVLRASAARVRTAAARLASVLRLDPAVVLLPAERLAVTPALVDLQTPLEQLVDSALRRRPELKANAAAVSAAQHQRSAAKYGPLIPTLGAVAVYGEARGGAGTALTPYQSAHDYAVGLTWRFGPGGLFDFSRTEAADASLERTQLTGEQLHQAVIEQVVSTLTAAQAAHDQVQLARRGVDLAERSLQLSMQRKNFGVYAVTEVIQAQQDYARARSSYALALSSYAKAQYALAGATGQLGR
ncbi:MAG: TolC family protein [Steroidobacteraceae bacterium]